MILAYIIFGTDTKFPFDIPILNQIDDEVADVFSPKDDPQSNDDENIETTPSDGATIIPSAEEMTVHVIDVGQGSSTLFVADDRTILIDAGENGMGNKVKSYLDELGIDSIDLFIGTHPHSDHIGGMDELMRTVDLQTIIMPELPSSIIPTTKTYLDVLEMIDNQNKEVTIAEIGDEYIVGDMSIEILGPVEPFDDLNEISVISRVTFGENSVIVSGDAERDAEKATVEKFRSILSSSIYIVAHHGSSTSSSKDFLDAINPKYGAISLSADNSYGHPHRETISELNGRNIEYYRTDERGTITFHVSNDGIRVECER